MQIGPLRVDVVPCGAFRLDGGAMFGQVPRVRWETLMPPDDRNRVRLGTNALLVRGPAFALLIESGCGTRWSDEERAYFGMEDPGALERGLGQLGVGTDDVTHVTCSHLHFDHGGGLFAGGPGTDGEDAEPRFPRAQHLLPLAELEAAIDPPPFQKASYRGPYRVLRDRGLVREVGEDEEVLPGVRVRRTGGHTDGHQIVLLESGSECAAFFGDLVPTSHHLPPAYTMAYDMQPSRVMAAKRELLDIGSERGWTAFFYHDPDPRPGRLRREGRRYHVERLDA